MLDTGDSICGHIDAMDFFRRFINRFSNRIDIDIEIKFMRCGKKIFLVEEKKVEKTQPRKNFFSVGYKFDFDIYTTLASKKISHLSAP
jgi:hypothetical protein